MGTKAKKCNSEDGPSEEEKLIHSRLKSLYYGVGNEFAFSTAIKLYNAVDREIPLTKIMSWLESSRLYYNTDNISSFWEVDLMDLQNLATENDQFRYALIAVDSFSRFVYGRLLKGKTSSVANLLRQRLDQALNIQAPTKTICL